VEEDRALLETLEQGIASGRLDQPLPVLAFLAGREVPLTARELHGARRRALLLLAAGGDPHRGLVPDSRAVTSLAAELGTDERRAALGKGLADLRARSSELPVVRELLGILLGDSELAWRTYACALLGEELAEN
jgi:hypothetical protein